MTCKSAKTALFALLIAAMILPYSATGVADVASDEKGTTEIRTEKRADTVMEDAIKELEKLQEKLEQATDEAQIEGIFEEMTRVKEDVKNQLPKIDAEERFEYDRLTIKVADEIFDLDSKDSDKRKIPVTKIGFDRFAGALVVAIEPEFATSENMQEYVGLIREIAGDEPNIVMEKGSIWHAGDCSIQTADCETVEDDT